MSETSFSINDLLRRKMQTSLVVISLALCVASTLFLLLFAQKMGFGISSVVEDKLTAGFSQIFSPFITLLAILISAAGIVMISFTAFVMTSQRTRDIGLMKAVGCPNDLLFGYFFTELLIVGFVGCLVGTILGVLMDMGSTSVLNGLGLQTPQQPTDLWIPFAVFIAFFALSLVLGGAPVLSTIKVEPAKAFSPAHYLGLTKEPGFKIMSKSGVSLKIAVRTLVRRKSATIRIVLCLSFVFLLVTVAVAGGLIAEDTTRSWVEKAVGRNVLLIAHPDMINQYKLLLSEFYEGQKATQFGYTDERYLIPSSLNSQLRSINGITGLDARLVLEEPVKEVPGIIFGNSTAETRTVGDDRQGESLVVGVDPGNVLNDWALNGRFLASNQASEAVVGDTIGQKLFSEPLIQGIRVSNESLSVVGVCLDPINNGNVTYVPLATLQAISGVSGTNVLMVKLEYSSNEADILNNINATVAGAGFQVYDLDEVVKKSVDFLNFLWSTIMFLPLFSLITASLSLLGYVMLTINEQRQEFGILRALGAKPRNVLAIVSAQSLIVLLGSYAVGIAFGVITTLLILVEKPLVTTYTIMEIAGWLLLALIATFATSVYPAIRFAKKPLLETIMQS
ncbi:MAG TPA: FtsX-like permease family protein [candidate division Zixibacteria bacterium]|nr:FtsX-like permease family protein [candidate division Zixibacteria bacterium]